MGSLGFRAFGDIGVLRFGLQGLFLNEEIGDWVRGFGLLRAVLGRAIGV